VNSGVSFSIAVEHYCECGERVRCRAGTRRPIVDQANQRTTDSINCRLISTPL